MIYLDAIVLGHPRSQPRPRGFRAGAVETDSDASARWKAIVVAAIQDAGFDRPPPGTPLELVLEFAVPTIQEARHGLPAIAVPDLDNLTKAVADALMELTGRRVSKAIRDARLPPYAGVIDDDAAITDMVLRKRWSPRPGGVRIILRDPLDLEPWE